MVSIGSLAWVIVCYSVLVKISKDAQLEATPLKEFVYCLMDSKASGALIHMESHLL